MKAVIVGNDPSDLQVADDPVGDRFVSDLFHGFAYRKKPDPDAAKAAKHLEAEGFLQIFVDARAELEGACMHLSRIGNYIPDILRPFCFDWVISERVRQAMGLLPNVELRPVRFEKLVHYDFPEDVWNYRVKKWIEPEALIRKSKNVPKYHVGLPQYYEVRAQYYGKISQEFREANCGVFATIKDVVPKLVNTRQLSDYPLLDVSRSYLLREDVFRKIESYFDWRFFGFHEFEVADSA